MKFYPFLILTVIFSGVIAVGCLNTLDDEEIESDVIVSGEYSETAKSGITLKWRIIDNGANLEVVVTAPTTGWVSAGFDPTMQMKDANIIIGYVTGGEVRLRDDFGSAPIMHDADTSLGGTDNILSSHGSESGGMTEIAFTIPLDSGDSRDRKLVSGESYTVILAYGNDNDDSFDGQHKVRTAVQITL